MANPRMVYDDDCGFCTWCARVAAKHAEVEPVGFSELSPDQKARLPNDWRNSAHLLTDDTVYSAGEAIEQVLARMNVVLRAVVALLRRLPGYAERRERLYRWAANRRDWWGKVVSAESV